MGNPRSTISSECLDPFRWRIQVSYRSKLQRAHFAWTSRQLPIYGVHQAIANVSGRKAQARDLQLVHDVCHTIAKIEEYEIDGQKRRVCAHRKGITRAFHPQYPPLSEKYRSLEQPVLISGDMGRYSFMLVGAIASLEQGFGSRYHRIGRKQSRTATKKSLSPRALIPRTRYHRMRPQPRSS